MPYPDSEQLPKRGYTVQAIPLRALARSAVGANLGIAYPDREQATKRSYVLGSVPLRALARAAVAFTPQPPGDGNQNAFIVSGSQVLSWSHQYPDDTDKRIRDRFDIQADDKELLELTAVLAYTINVWQRNG